MLINQFKIYNNKIYFVLLLLVAALIPTAEFPVKAASLSIIVFTLWWLISGDYKQKFDRLKSNKLLWLFAALFLVNLPGLLRTSHPDEAYELLVRKLPLLLFPLIIGTSFRLTRQQINYIILAFISGLFIVSLFTFREGVEAVLNRHDLTTMVRLTVLHRAYSGMFSAFAIIGLIHLFRYYRSPVTRAVLILAILYFSFFIYILYVKMTIIALSVLFLFFILIGAVKKLGKDVVLVATLLFVISAAWYITTNERTRTVYEKIIKFEDFSYQEYNIHLVSSINIRYINWGCSVEVLKQEQNWLTGLGIGNAQEQLNLCYKDLNPWIYESEMNAHNDYLEEMLRNGIAGLLILLLGLALPAAACLRYKNYTYLSFLILFAVCMVTENLLSRQAGIMFYALFNAVFAFNCFELSKTGNKDKILPAYTNKNTFA